MRISNQLKSMTQICQALDLDITRLSSLSIVLDKDGIAVNARYIMPDLGQTDMLCGALEQIKPALDAARGRSE